MHTARHVVLCIAAIAAALTSAHSAFAQAKWPQHAVRLIAPLPPGTAVDVSARLFAERLTAKWGQGVVVENRQGADGIVAVTALLAASDGHTLLISFGGVTTLNPLLHKNLQYDPHDLVPITLVVDNYLGLAVTSDLKVNSVAELRQDRPRRAGQVHLGGDAGSDRGHRAGVPEERRDRHAAGELQQLQRRAAGSGAGPAASRRHQPFGAVAADPGRKGQIADGDQSAAFAAGARRADRARSRFSQTSRSRVSFCCTGRAACRRSCASVSPPISARSPRTPELRKRLDAMGLTVRVGTPAEAVAELDEQTHQARSRAQGVAVARGGTAAAKGAEAYDHRVAARHRHVQREPIQARTVRAELLERTWP